MTIQRPNCMKTFRQGSVSISLCLAARSCAVARPSSGVSGYQDPAGDHEEGAEANHRERPVLGTTALRIRCRTPTRRAWALFRARGRGRADHPVLARRDMMPRAWFLLGPSLVRLRGPDGWLR